MARLCGNKYAETSRAMQSDVMESDIKERKFHGWNSTSNDCEFVSQALRRSECLTSNIFPRNNLITQPLKVKLLILFKLTVASLNDGRKQFIKFTIPSGRLHHYSMLCDFPKKPLKKHRRELTDLSSLYILRMALQRREAQKLAFESLAGER